MSCANIIVNCFFTALCILVTHLLLKAKVNFIPESVAIVFLGALIGLTMKLLSNHGLANWQKEEAFPPTLFFLLMLPPIIFESGYNLHKGNFFQNIGSILTFAVLGTTVSAFIIGGGLYFLGQAEVVYTFSAVESFAFGSLISAVDPVATLAIFQAIDVEPVLYMLVFGESVLNDAVAIVLTTTVLELEKSQNADMTAGASFLQAVGTFCMMFFGSAAIGVVTGLVSALFLKHIDLRNTPSLEFGLMMIFSYLPYGLAEGLHLSGIMAILFCGIVMSHYTHYNLSPVTQITVQQTFRTLSFMAETCVFAYLGMAIFSFNHILKPATVIWAIVLCLLSRATNIFPLSYLCNYFREHKITKKMQFVMWFSGLRGAVAYALCLHLGFQGEKGRILVTTTLVTVLFSVLILGGSTMPILKFLNTQTPARVGRTRKPKEVTLSKTREMGDAVDSEHLSEMTDQEYEVNFVRPHLTGFVKLDVRYLNPFFTRRFTQQELPRWKERDIETDQSRNQEVAGETVDIGYDFR
ncbi:PREDICTED: sodium/hydrogen exchanger 8-like [Priapulus caudatus]|uniref:Sodium/hydrogen exchanger n=1 Tax=Priapulus caudatus TaxID=37621 RepID=A0ABM1EUY6_PRICU|nr:PREDICTED: sodium/hydrogen exchanger 8-like [Priapulus caudatus]